MPVLSIDTGIALAALAISIIGVLVAVVGILISIHKKKLLYTTASTSLIDSKTSGIQNHTIVVDGKSAQALVKTTVTIRNSGIHQIEKSDFSETLPLRITTTGCFFHPASGYIVKAKDPGSIKVNPLDEHTIAIDCAYIKSHGGFSIDVLHDGDLSVSGELKTGAMKPDKFVARSCIAWFTIWLVCVCVIEILCFIALLVFIGSPEDLAITILLISALTPFSLYVLWAFFDDLSIFNRHTLFENVLRAIRSDRKTKPK